MRCAIILGFYAGLRAGEIARLTLSNLIYDGGYVLCIRKSKTNNGVRNVPLYLLMPEKYLKEIVSFWKEEIVKHPGKAPFLVRNGKGLNSKKLSIYITKTFKEHLGIIIRFHHLRHSFANWFLIRWFAAIYGREHFDVGAPFLKNILFSDDYLGKIRILLFGHSELKKGQVNFSHVFAALARLIGHGSPKMTIENYIHTIDFLAYLFFRRKYANYQVRITSKGLADLLNVCYEALPEHFRGKVLKNINTYDIIDAQRRRLSMK